MKSNTAKIELNELEVLFEALKENSAIPLSKALESVVALAKKKRMNADQLVALLDSYGVQSTDKLKAWIKNKF